MDFIERLFGLSPDGGSGVFECLLFVVPALCLGILQAARSMRVKRKV